jgi:hypothetical protein
VILVIPHFIMHVPCAIQWDWRPEGCTGRQHCAGGRVGNAGSRDRGAATRDGAGGERCRDAGAGAHRPGGTDRTGRQCAACATGGSRSRRWDHGGELTAVIQSTPRGLGSGRFGWPLSTSVNTTCSGPRAYRLTENFGCSSETRRNWVRREERERGRRSGPSSDERTSHEGA